MTVIRPATIIGGLPVIVEIAFGVDDSPVTGREYWSEVEAIFWRKRDGSKGKEIPQHVWDKAEKYDSGFCNLIEQVTEDLAHENNQPTEEMVQFT